MGMLKGWIRSALFTFCGGLLGLGYYTYVGCPTGTCPITSSPMSTMVYTGLIGLLVSRIISERKKE